MKKLLTALVAVLTICLLAGIPIAPAAQAAGAYWIGVDITNQITTVYRSSDDSVVRHMLCSTGLDETPTPTGTFYMPKKAYAAERTEWYYFKEFDCYAKYATRIKGGILFHSVIYGSKSDSSLRSSSVRNLGKKASHGCIRLTVDNAKWIAKNCPAGTKVKIYYGKKNADLKQQLTGSYQTLTKGDSGKSVKSLQERLKECGWYNGSITGKYDSATQNAVKAFQKAQGLTADGIAWPQTLSALDAAWNAEFGVPEDAYAPCCGFLEIDADGTQYWETCEVHTNIYLHAADELPANASEAEIANVYAVAWQTELERLYQLWLDNCEPEDQPMVVNHKVMFEGHLNSQIALWSAQYGEGSLMVLRLVNETMEEQCYTLCPVVYALTPTE